MSRNDCYQVGKRESEGGRHCPDRSLKPENKEKLRVRPDLKTSSSGMKPCLRHASNDLGLVSRGASMLCISKFSNERWRRADLLAVKGGDVLFSGVTMFASLDNRERYPIFFLFRWKSRRRITAWTLKRLSLVRLAGCAIKGVTVACVE